MASGTLQPCSCGLPSSPPLGMNLPRRLFGWMVSN